MPIIDISPMLNEANISLKPEDILLKKGSLVRFSSLYNTSGDTKWASGKLFIIDSDPVFMKVPYSNIIANGDWCNIDLTVTKMGPPPSPGVPHPTSAQQFAKQLYPVSENVLYQIGVGMKPGSYIVLTYIPYGGNPIYQLGSTSIIATVNDPVYRYFGVRRPPKSPNAAPTCFLYTIQGMDQVVLQQYMDGGETMATDNVSYGKATFEFSLNKCHLNEVKRDTFSSSGIIGMTFEQARDRALYIPHFKELQLV